MKNSLGLQLLAAGRRGLPNRFELSGTKYQLNRVFKHDFFAATALYTPVLASDACAAGLVLKLSRQGDFLGIPLAWLGACLSRHEYSILEHLQGLDGIAKLVGRYGKAGILYEYVDGVSLDDSPEIPDDFFAKLKDLLGRIHRRKVAYVDMNKRGNIIVRPDGEPLMIDFQISWHVSSKPLAGLVGLSKCVFGRLAGEDYYHLLKHKRRLRPDLMSDSEIEASRKVSSLICLHRLLARPITLLRRRLLCFLWRKNILPSEQNGKRSPENDPSRWAG